MKYVGKNFVPNRDVGNSLFVMLKAIFSLNIAVIWGVM